MAGVATWTKLLLCMGKRDGDAADEDRTERGLPLERMDTAGIRSRLNAGRQPTVVDEEVERPPATSGTVRAQSGNGVGQATEDQELDVNDSFIKSSLRRLTSTFGPGSAEHRAQKRERLDIKYGYAGFKKARYQSVPKGFPRLATFMATTDVCQMTRGYNVSHNRIIAQLSVELAELEKQLADLDKSDEIDTITSHRLVRTLHKQGFDEEQKKLLELFRVKLKQYDEIVLNHARMQALGKPPKRDFLAFFNWYHKHPQLAIGYDDFIYHADDFLSMSGSHSNFFEGFLRGHLKHWPMFLKKRLITNEELAKMEGPDPSLTFYSSSKLRGWAAFFLVLTTVGFLLTPVFLLFLVPMSRAMMAVTASIFIVLFSVLVSVVTGAQVYKVFVSTATYSAILVTFLGNISEGSTSASA